MFEFFEKQARKRFRPQSAIFVIQNQFEVFYFQVLRLNCIKNKGGYYLISNFRNFLRNVTIEGIFLFHQNFTVMGPKFRTFEKKIEKKKIFFFKFF